MDKWFEQRVEYRGQGRALFEDPSGSFSGSTVVTASATAGPEFKMKVEQHCPKNPEINWHVFFYCQEEKNTKGGSRCWTMGTGSRPNLCNLLEVETPSGMLSIKQGLEGYTVDGGRFTMGSNASPRKIVFRPLRCWYRAKTTSRPKYWAIPIVNYTGFRLDSPFSAAAEHLENHPLRLFSNAGLTTFSYRGNPAFIEAITQYRTAVSQVLDGRKQAITAVMVGEIGADHAELDNDIEPLPMRLLFPLQLARGAPLGCPWIEYRDEDGGLVARCHIGSTTIYTMDHNEIIEKCYIGRLLDCAANAEVQLDANTLTCIAKLVTSLQDGGNIELAMAHAASAADILLKKYRITERTIADSLDEQTRKRLQEILSGAAEKTRNLSTALKDEGKDEMAAAVEKASSRILSADGKPGNFGTKIRQLLEGHDFQDMHVVDKHFPPPGAYNWEDRVSKFRTIAVHGFLTFEEGNDEMDEMWEILHHLQDIVLRVLFKTLGFPGPYNPICLRGRGSEPVDWVKPTTSPGSLGYRDRKER